jgi:hypothetical protein
MRMRQGALAVGVTTVVGVTAALASSTLIVPGTSIGPVKIGMTKAQLARAWPYKHTSFTTAGITTYSYRRGGLSSILIYKKKVAGIYTISSKWHTKNGVKIGTSLASLRARYHVSCHNQANTQYPTDCRIRSKNGYYTTFHISQPPDPGAPAVDGIHITIR